MRPFLIVFDSPPLDFAARVGELNENGPVRTLLSQAAVEALRVESPGKAMDSPASALFGQCSQLLEQFPVAILRRRTARRVIPISPQARRCDRLWGPSLPLPSAA